jgi:hypothetical protein
VAPSSGFPAWASSGGIFGDTQRRRLRAPVPPFIPFARGDAGVRPFAPPGLGYVPSAQRFARMAPSEQAGFAGHLESELGVNAPDAFWLMDKLRPKRAVGAAPRWAVM